MTASETQPTAVLRDSNAVNSTMSGFERRGPRGNHTILTFMTRMAGNGWLRVGKRGNVNVYEPALAQKAGLEGEIERFLDEVVGGESEAVALVERAIARRSKR